MEKNFYASLTVRNEVVKSLPRVPVIYEIKAAKDCDTSMRNIEIGIQFLCAQNSVVVKELNREIK